jgi:recombinational DNA repair protein (RecF pathway)
VTLRLAPAGIPCVDLFKVHSNALVALEEAASSEKLLALANLYLVKVLSWCGNQPQLLRCLKCDKGIQKLTERDWVEGDIQAAGWICSECASAVSGKPSKSTKQIPSDALKDLLFGASESLRKAIVQARGVREEHAPLFSFLTRVLAFHIPGFDQLSMKSLRFLTGDKHQ